MPPSMWVLARVAGGSGLALSTRASLRPSAASYVQQPYKPQLSPHLGEVTSPSRSACGLEADATHATQYAILPLLTPDGMWRPPKVLK